MGRACAFSGAAAKDSRESPLAKLLIGGSVTVLFEAFAGGHFLEFLKISKQTSPNETYMQITRRIMQHKGLAGTLDGFVPWGMAQCIAKGAVFSFGQAQALVLLHDNKYISPQASMVLSGGIGGFIQGVVMSPLLLLKTRVMTDPAFRAAGSAWETSVRSAKIGARVIRSEGMLALCKGMLVFSNKRFADWTSRYFFVVLLEQQIKDHPNDRLTGQQQVVCSLGGGSLSALATIPIDVLVAAKQDAAKAGQKVSVIDLYREKIRSGGLGGTFKFATAGLVARVAHVALTTLMMKTVTSKVYDLVYRQ